MAPDGPALPRQSIVRILNLLEDIQSNVEKALNELTDFDPLSKTVRWSAIFVGGVANVSFAGYYAFTTILEAEGIWSLRLWMITQERWWFLLATLILALALALDVWAFILGEDVDATILLLCFELGVAISKVLVQAIRTHSFRMLLYECWSGRSRTARPRSQEWLRDVHEVIWRDAISQSQVRILTYPTESSWNPHNIVRARHKLRYDVTEAMNVVSQALHEQSRDRNPHDDTHVGESGYLQVYVHHTDADMSVAWGGNDSKLFQKRVSRGISALQTRQVIDAYDLRVADTDRWRIAADGILSRNKGLQPWKMICKRIVKPDNPAESSSPLYPRASKTLYSRVRGDVHAQYNGLGEDFIEAGTELNLLMRDVNMSMLYRWLTLESEHQDLTADWSVFRDARSPKLNELLYVIQYVGMLVSLHFLQPLNCTRVDELVLLVAVRCMLESDDVDFGGISREELRDAGDDGGVSIQKAKQSAALLGPASIRITCGYLGVWLSPEQAQEWTTWISGLDDNWSALLQEL